MTAVPLSWPLILAAALFCVGLYAVLARRNAVAVLMGVELMLNGVIVNLVAFWRYADPATLNGQAFADRNHTVSRRINNYCYHRAFYLYFNRSLCCSDYFFYILIEFMERL